MKSFKDAIKSEAVELNKIKSRIKALQHHGIGVYDPETDTMLVMDNQATVELFKLVCDNFLYDLRHHDGSFGRASSELQVGWDIWIAWRIEMIGDHAMTAEQVNAEIDDLLRRRKVTSADVRKLAADLLNQAANTIFGKFPKSF